MSADEQRSELEEAIVSLYTALFRLRQAGKVQEEYDAMGTLVDMLVTDRDHIRAKYRETIKP